MNLLAIIRRVAQGYRRRPGALLLLLLVVAVIGFNGWLTGRHPAARVSIPPDGGSTTLLRDGRTLLTQRYHWTDKWRPFPGPKHFWDVKTGAHRGSLGSPDTTSTDVCVSPDARWAVLRDTDDQLSLWDVGADKQLAILCEGLGKGWALGDSWVRVRSDTYMQSWYPPDSLVRFSADSRWLAITPPGDRPVRLWEIATRRELGRLETAETRFASRITFSLDGKRAATVRKDGGVELWDISDGLRRTALLTGPTLVEHVAFSPDGRLLAGTNYFAGTAIAVQLWDVTTGVLRDVIPRSGTSTTVPYFFHLEFSPDSRLLLGPGCETESLLWDVTTSPPTPLDEHARPAFAGLKSLDQAQLFGVPAPVFSADARWIGVVQREAGICTILDATTLNRHQVLSPDHQGETALRLVFSPCGTTVALMRGRTQQVPVSTSYFGRPPMTPRSVWAVQVYDLATGSELAEFPGQFLGFTPDGRSVLTKVDTSAPSGLRIKTTVKRWELHPGPSVPLLIGIAATAMLIVLGGCSIRQRVLASRL